MAKRLGGSPKEQTVSLQAEARELLWGAIPPRLGDNRKSWIIYAARILGWTERRVRAVWNGEARRIDAHEMRQLEDLYAARQQRAEQRRKDRHELLQLSREAVPVAERSGD